ncbi:hypothetical protein QBC38DRAFT_494462 [Podospora fimiseda]|uniref:Uncharacterized protein n=1 Tax=Podospora fimiseda TaxID=252190 RepID=A0AAN6YQA0_9PEZI|nr:hypothetical protein QBC38DRAFT_494462 [Podospora fimiseda]
MTGFWVICISISCIVDVLVKSFTVPAVLVSGIIDASRRSGVYVLLTARTCLFCLILFYIPLLWHATRKCDQKWG